MLFQTKTLNMSPFAYVELKVDNTDVRLKNVELQTKHQYTIQPKQNV